MKENVMINENQPIWHDARKEKQPQGVCDNNPVLLIGIRRGRVSYSYLWSDWEQLYEDIELMADTPIRIYERVLWAYVRDLVPNVKGKGE